MDIIGGHTYHRSGPLYFVGGQAEKNNARCSAELWWPEPNTLRLQVLLWMQTMSEVCPELIRVSGRWYPRACRRSFLIFQAGAAMRQRLPAIKSFCRGWLARQRSGEHRLDLSKQYPLDFGKKNILSGVGKMRKPQ